MPVVHACGGLKDTVVPFNPWEEDESKKGEQVGSAGPSLELTTDAPAPTSAARLPAGSTGTGWAFTPCTIDSMIGSLKAAIDTYRNYRWVPRRCSTQAPRAVC